MWTNANLVVRYVVLTAVALLVFMPFVLAFLGTFKTNLEIIAFPPTFLPRKMAMGKLANSFSERT